MATKAEQSDTTRRALVAAARRLFAENGFKDTSTEAVVQAAGVTRGALYHHFKDKTALFRAVYESLEEELVTNIAVSVEGGHGDPLTMLRRGSQAFLDACLEPAVQRIVLLEAPTVLGWETWREIDQRYGLGLVKSVLELGVKTNHVRDLPIDPMAHVILGALVEASMLLANSPNKKKARADLGLVLDALIDGLADTTPVEPEPPTTKRQRKDVPV